MANNIHRPGTKSALSVEARLKRQHLRWIASQHTDFGGLWRHVVRRYRQYWIALDQTYARAKSEFPRLFRFGELFLIAMAMTVLTGMIWAIIQLVIHALQNASPVKAQPEIRWQVLLGWLPTLFGAIHLFFLAVDSTRQFGKQTSRPVVLRPQFHWFAAAIFVIWSLPISFAATSLNNWAIAMCSNLLFVGVCARAVQIAGSWIVASRKTDQLDGLKTGCNWKAAVVSVFAWVLIRASVFCLAFWPGDNFWTLNSAVLVLELVSQGNISNWRLITFWILGMAIAVWQFRIGKSQKTIEFRRRLIGGFRDFGKVPIERLEGIAEQKEGPGCPADVTNMIEKELRTRRRPLAGLWHSVVRDTGFYSLFPWFLILYCVYGFQQLSLVNVDPLILGADSHAPFESLVHLLLPIWVAIEGRAYLHRSSKKVREASKRPVSDLSVLVEFQSRGVTRLVQFLIASIPVLYFACLPQGWNFKILLALATVVLAHLTLRNILATIDVGLFLEPLIPQWLLKSDLGGMIVLFAGLLSFFPTVLGLVLVANWFGDFQIATFFAMVFGLSVVGFLVVTGIKAHFCSEN